MSTPLGEGGNASEDQIRFFKEFFQEEFEDPDDLLSPSKRDRVPRQRVRAALARLPPTDDPSRHVAIAKTLYQTFSGFLHGAYVHIMDLFGGNPPRFHTRGLLGTPRVMEALRNHVSYVYRSLLAVEVVARRADREDVTNHLADLGIELAQKTGCLDDKGVQNALRRRAQAFVKPS